METLSRKAQDIELAVYAAAVEGYRSGQQFHKAVAAQVAAFRALPAEWSYSNKSRIATRIAAVAIRSEREQIIR